MNMDSQWSKQETCFARVTRCGSLSITTPVSLLANDFNVRSVLHRQDSSAAVYQICVNHVAKNGCKNLKVHQRLASKTGLPRSGKKFWKMKNFPGQGKVRELHLQSGKF